MKQYLKPVWYIPLVVIVFACRHAPPMENRLEQLAKTFHDLDCRQRQLEEAARSSWDGVVEQLNADLPTDMPAAEKHNMLSVRNASLIRMFESYRELPDSVQELVTQAEQKDNEVVAALNELKAQKLALDKEKRDLFLAIEKRSEKDLSSFRTKFETAKQSPCE